ncbi:ABC transporter ATP-binding protein [Undibacterium squillarum]|uniref:ABC transporter ATP-binding protein n=1 Tax=Undibacterium squillarum TaxID=1131567 RepID=UPI0035B4EB8E
MHTEKNSDALLQIRNLNISFKNGKHSWHEAVKNVSFSIPSNQTVALVGESGSGKSVSSLAVMGLLPADTSRIAAGSEILFNGVNLLKLSPAERRALCGKDIAMIFQEPMSSLNPVLTVGYQIGEVLRLHQGMNRKQARARAIALLEEVGIPDPANKVDSYPCQMSGGQQQRVMIAMAIACEPRLLIADEPTTALDVTIQKQIIDLIKSLQQKHQMAVLFITHDLALVGEVADQVIVMRHGEIREQGEASQIFTAPQDQYTRALLHCRPDVSHRPLRLPVIADFMQENAPTSSTTERQRGWNSDDEIILKVSNLSKHFSVPDGLFRSKTVRAVDNVSFELAKGKTLGIVGESGSGKTTVGLTLMRLHQATGGEAWYKGQNILSMPEKAFHPLKPKIQIIFQNPYASLNPRFTIGQILTEPMQFHQIGNNDAERLKMATALLDKVSLPATALQRYPHEFSGGQRQRIAIARCLSMKPEILICDESVSALDVSVQAQVLNLLQDLQDEFGLSYLFISHDLAVVKYISDQVLVMQHGKQIECGNADALYASPQHDYTRKLLAAVPRGYTAQQGHD